MKVLFVSLGCDKNRVDSEVMLGMLEENGFELTQDDDEAEAAIVNTCCFINDAKQESIDTILELADRRKNGSLKALVISGCLAQRYREEIQKEIPEVDAIVGISAIDKIIEALKSALDGKSGSYYEDLSRSLKGNNKRILTTGGHYSYLKIAEGCDKNCTYCIIPKVRGHYRSVPMEDLIAEAKQLAGLGVTELIIVAQETTIYGTDLYGRKALPELLTKLCKIDELKSIRVMYCYPEEITPELIKVIKEEDKICDYLDIPIQSGSDEILRKMGRRTNRAEIISLVKYIRKEIPDICIRTTLITGFPGETANDHKQTMDMVSELKFDRLGVFTYSQEEDTPAAVMDNQVTERVKKTRQNKLMKLQQEIAFEAARGMVGRKVSVVIDGRIDDEESTYGTYTYVGRTYKDAPDIDGYIFLPNVPYDLCSGVFVEAVVTDSNDYDLIGEIVE